MATRRYGEGSVFFDEGRDRWVGRLDLEPDPATGNRRRRTVIGRTRAEVLRKLDAIKAEQKAGVSSDGSLTFGQFLERWLSDVLPARSRVKSRNTQDNYGWAVERHLSPALGQVKLSQLTPEHVEGLLRSMAERGLRRNTIGRVRSVAVMALRHGQRRSLVVRNAAELAEMPADARSPEEGRSLTADEGHALLDSVAGSEIEPLVTVGLMLGLRPGELLGLRWDDVDLDGATLKVTGSLKRERGSDGHQVLKLGTAKTSKSVRALNVPSPVVEALRRRKAQQAAHRLVAGQDWSDIGLVFTTENGTPIDPSNLRRTFASATKKAGLGAWHPNELRHSAASLLSAAGVPQEQVADLLGHSDTRMLDKHYRHRVTSTVAAAVEPMEAMFGGR
jgi:integrase